MVKPAEDVQGDRVVVAEVRFQNVQGFHEVVSSIDFVAFAFLKLRQVSQGVAEHLMVGPELLASDGHCIGVETLRFVELLPALMLAALLDQVGDFAQGRAALVIRFAGFGEFILGKNQSRLRFCHVGPFKGSRDLAVSTEGWLFLLCFSCSAFLLPFLLFYHCWFRQAYGSLGWRSWRFQNAVLVFLRCGLAVSRTRPIELQIQNFVSDFIPCLKLSEERLGSAGGWFLN